MNCENFPRYNEIITDRRFQFAFKCLQKVMMIKLKKNIVLSPYNLYEALLIMSLIVSGSFEERLRRILNLSDFTKSELNDYCHFRSQTREWNYYSNVSSLNKECYMQRNKAFSTRRQWHFNKIGVFPNYFYKTINIMRTITSINGKIEKLLNDGICDSVKLSVVRLNMEFIYFDIIRLYVEKFGTLSTSPDQRKRRSFFSYELSMHVSEFSYQDGYTSLYILLPAILSSNQWTIKWDATEGDILNLIERLSTEEGICKFRKLLDSETTSEDDIALSTWPIFRVERNLKFRELLAVLGAQQLLMPDAIDVTVSEENYSSVRIGNAVHRAGVKVTEEKIVASAITVFYTGQESSPSTKYVEVNYNYPFVWLIYDKRYKSILLAGVFNKLAESASQN